MGKIALLFAGQGAQYVGMGSDLYGNIPVCKDLFTMGESIRKGTVDQCFRSDEETLKQTENTQPCLFLTDLCCALALKEQGISGDYVAGFSLGEIPALAYAGILSKEDAFRLVIRRGEAMAACAKETPGSMAAVMRLDNETVERIAGEFEGVYPVNYNCPGQLVIAGKEDTMPLFLERMKEERCKIVPLAVSGAFHTPFMKEASKALLDILGTMDVRTPEIPVLSNTTGMPYPDDPEKIREGISEQVTHPVRFEETLRYLASEGVTDFIEVGPGKALSGFVKKTLEGVGIYRVYDMATLQETVSALKGN